MSRSLFFDIFIHSLQHDGIIVLLAFDNSRRRNNRFSTCLCDLRITLANIKLYTR